jgi:uncharacterized delta-60 repeat protein
MAGFGLGIVISLTMQSAAFCSLSSFAGAPSRCARRLITFFFAGVALAGWEAAAADEPPGIVEAPASLSVTAGGIASFRVVATGAAPLAYQWFHDAQPIPGATNAILVLDQLKVPQAGLYAAAVSNTSGRVTTASAMLEISPSTATPIVDLSFHGDARLDGEPTALLPLPDGRVLLAAGMRGALVRLLSDGRLDTTFAAGTPHEPFAAFDSGFIRQLVAQPDGKILAAGYFADYQEIARPGLVRINVDGTVDATFLPAIGSALEPSKLRPANEVFAIALQTDGKVLAHDGNHRLIRLLSDGSRDLGFSPASLNGGVCTAFALAADGRIYVAGFTPTSVARLLPDGTEDLLYPRRPIDLANGGRLFALDDGRLLVNSSKVSGPAIPGVHIIPIEYTLARWLADGSIDLTFPSTMANLLTPPARDGSVFLPQGLLINADGSKTQLNLGNLSYDNRGNTPSYLPAFAPDGRIYLTGQFSFYDGVVTSRVVRLNRVAASATVVSAAPRLLAAWSESPTVAIGDAVVFHAAAIGPGPLTYEWRQGNGSSDRTATPDYAFAPGYLNETADWSVRVLNAAGEARSQSFHVEVQPATLRVVEQPARVSLSSGREAGLHVTFAKGSVPTGEIWRRDGAVLPTTRRSDQGYPVADVVNDVAYLNFGIAGPALAGSYTVTVTNALGQTATSAPIVVTVDDNSRFVNLSTRAFVGSGDQAAVLGLVIPPGRMRSVVLRGIGPTLANFGVLNALADARLELFDSTGRRMAVNDDWTDFIPHRTFADIGAFPLAAGSRDAVIDCGLSPGAYTVRLSAPAGVTGVGLVELYESDNISERLLNLSSRVFVGPNATPAIAGFVIRGSVAKRVLVRAVGPGLTAFGVAGALADPRLEIRDAAGAVVAANDDWQEQTAAASIGAAMASAGAFSLTSGSRDAALVVSLPAGNYTALVSAANAGQGIVLLEVYELP